MPPNVFDTMDEAKSYMVRHALHKTHEIVVWKDRVSGNMKYSVLMKPSTALRRNRLKRRLR